MTEQGLRIARVKLLKSRPAGPPGRRLKTVLTPPRAQLNLLLVLTLRNPSREARNDVVPRQNVGLHHAAGAYAAFGSENIIARRNKPAPIDA